MYIRRVAVAVENLVDFQNAVIRVNKRSEELYRDVTTWVRYGAVRPELKNYFNTLHNYAVRLTGLARSDPAKQNEAALKAAYNQVNDQFRMIQNNYITQSWVDAQLTSMNNPYYWSARKMNEIRDALKLIQKYLTAPSADLEQTEIGTEAQNYFSLLKLARSLRK
jgi:hypothetical protein